MSTLNLMSAPEAAVVLGISEVRVRQLCRKGRLGNRVGKQWIITSDELKQFAKVPRPAGNPAFQKNSKKSD